MTSKCEVSRLICYPFASNGHLATEIQFLLVFSYGDKLKPDIFIRNDKIEQVEVTKFHGLVI